MRDLLVVAIVLATIPFMFARPYVGVLVWSWIGYMNPHKLAWGWAQDFPLAMIAGGAALIAWLFAKDKERIPLNGVTITWFLLVVAWTASTFLALEPEEAWSQWEKVIKIQIGLLLTISLITNRSRLRLLVWVIVISLGFFGLKGGLYVLQTGGASGRVYGPPGGFIEGNNELAVALLMTLPLMYFLLQSEGNRWIRRVLLILMAFTVVSVLGSFSRGALLGLASCVLFLWGKSRQRLPIVIISAVGLVAVFNLMPDSWWDRMGTIKTYEEDTSATGRLDAWKLAVVMANHRILGGGFEFWSPEVYTALNVSFNKAQDAHSIYFEILGEHGWIGLVLFLGFFASGWRMLSRVMAVAHRSESLQWEADLSRMLQASLVAYAVGGAFLGLAYFDLPYHLVCLALIMGRYVDSTSSLPSPGPGRQPRARSPAGVHVSGAGGASSGGC